MKTNQLFERVTKTQEKIFSVSEFLDYLNLILTPQRVIIEGEIGEKINNYPNYLFFTLLDTKENSKSNHSILKCFAWRAVVEDLAIEIKPGMKIKVFGYPEVIKHRGELNFQVERIELLGEGILKKQFEILKKELTLLGYFNLENKKQIPKFPQDIGLITSKVGRGALKDFLSHLENFGFRIFFYETKVEGSFALSEILSAINWFNQNIPSLDVIVLIRGGGDWESLQIFNTKEIVKAIVASKIPIITGIGHEDDTTLADLAADLRLATPTAVAKFLSENWKIAKREIKDFQNNLENFSQRFISNLKEKLKFFESNFIKETKKEILRKKEKLDDLIFNLNLYFQNYFKDYEVLEKDFFKNELKIENKIKKDKEKVKDYLEKLDKNKSRWQEKVLEILEKEMQRLLLANPDLKLKQGYTITLDETGKIIKDIEKLKISQNIKTKFYKGQILSKIQKINPEK